MCSRPDPWPSAQTLLLNCWSLWMRILELFVFSTADIPEEVLASCGAADCGLNISVNSTATRPAQRLVWTLVGCYIGNWAGRGFGVEVAPGLG